MVDGFQVSVRVASRPQTPVGGIGGERMGIANRMGCLLHAAFASQGPDLGGPVDTELGTFHPRTTLGFCITKQIVVGEITDVAEAHWRNGYTIRTPVTLTVEARIKGSGPATVTFSTPYDTVDGVKRDTRLQMPMQPGPADLGKRYFIAYTLADRDTFNHDKGMPIPIAAIEVPTDRVLPTLAEMQKIQARLRAKHCGRF